MTTKRTPDPLAALELALPGRDDKLRVRVLPLVLAAEYAVQMYDPHSVGMAELRAALADLKGA